MGLTWRFSTVLSKHAKSGDDLSPIMSIRFICHTTIFRGDFLLWLNIIKHRRSAHITQLRPRYMPRKKHINDEAFDSIF